MTLNEQLMDDCIWKASKIILRHEITMDDYSGELTIGKKTYLVIPKEQMENQLKIYAKAIELYIESLSPKANEKEELK